MADVLDSTILQILCIHDDFMILATVMDKQEIKNIIKEMDDAKYVKAKKKNNETYDFEKLENFSVVINHWKDK